MKQTISKKRIIPILLCIALVLPLLTVIAGCNKNVGNNTDKISGIITNTDSITLNVGQSYDLLVADRELLTELNFSSSVESVATVSANGKITAVGKGQAAIAVTSGEFAHSVAVDVTENISYAVTLNRSNVNVGAGSDFDISAEVLKNGMATIEKVVWSFTDFSEPLSGLANITGTDTNALTVEALKTGSFTVIASFSGECANCTVTIVGGADILDYGTDQFNWELLKLPDINYAAKEHFALFSGYRLAFDKSDNSIKSTDDAWGGSVSTIYVSPLLLEYAAEEFGHTTVDFTFNSNVGSHLWLTAYGADDTLKLNTSNADDNEVTMRVPLEKLMGEDGKYNLRFTTGNSVTFIALTSLKFGDEIAEGLTESGTNWASQQYLGMWSGSELTFNGGIKSPQANNTDKPSDSIFIELSGEVIARAAAAGYTKVGIIMTSSANLWHRAHGGDGKLVYSVTALTQNSNGEVLLSDLQNFDGSYSLRFSMGGGWSGTHFTVASLIFTN